MPSTRPPRAPRKPHPLRGQHPIDTLRTEAMLRRGELLHEAKISTITYYDIIDYKPVYAVNIQKLLRVLSQRLSQLKGEPVILTIQDLNKMAEEKGLPPIRTIEEVGRGTAPRLESVQAPPQEER